MPDSGQLRLPDLRAVSSGRRKTPRARRWRLPRRTVRLRLAVLYGSLFFVSAFVLLALVYGGVVGVHGA